MLETFCLSVLGSGGVAGIFFALIRHYIERRLMEVRHESRNASNIKLNREKRMKKSHMLRGACSFGYIMQL